MNIIHAKNLILDIKLHYLQNTLVQVELESLNLATSCENTNEPISQCVFKQYLQSYIVNKIPINLSNTEFTALMDAAQITPYGIKVYSALRNIPFGKKSTYQDIAKQIDSHPRAVGILCRKNPFPLLIPCHRVVAKNNIGGFMGSNIEKIKLKERLLVHENQDFQAIAHLR